jgi:hypothetical protein
MFASSSMIGNEKKKKAFFSKIKKGEIAKK